MDPDTFFTSPRWDILNILSEDPSSPIEIAEKLNTTVSYVSQQLKLLEAAGLVIKKRTGAFEKGKPRTLFSISNELIYLVVLTRDFSEKKLIYLTDYHKTILKIWTIEDTSLHYYIAKLFWKLEESLEEINSILINTKTVKPKIILVSDSKKIKTKIDSYIKKISDKIEFDIISEQNISKISPESFFSLYDPKFILKQLKGGKEKKDG
jgi:predicted transcriptional regulator